ncbi:hypothetical protein [Consotaella aegiceratis]|uniref:hypothetical protein n=1 Tax=Consotaella aegiceratis TaxID=3097961 RepID=UPI002F41FA27
MDERLVNLEIFERNSEALVLASKLQAYGIFAHVDGPTAALPQRRPIQMGGIPVKVRAKDYEIAKAIMEDVSPAAAQPRRMSVRNGPAAGVLLCTGVMAALLMRARFEATNDGLFGITLFLLVVYVVAIGEAIRRRRQWWTLLTLPIPVALAVRLVAF